ncbi:MAG: zf-HC2 domain-containing protein [Gemmatimonadaceae bacterium]|nr:zf-HC2 domain-containing protein [Gemmatimonadaceae bacterium]
MSATDTGLDTVIAGVRCRDVLADLSEFLDGQLSSERVATLRAHLAACDRCARFGGDVSAALGALRANLRVPPPLAPEQTAQLRTSLRQAQSA